MTATIALALSSDGLRLVANITFSQQMRSDFDVSSFLQFTNDGGVSLSQLVREAHKIDDYSYYIELYSTEPIFFSNVNFTVTPIEQSTTITSVDGN